MTALLNWRVWAAIFLAMSFAFAGTYCYRKGAHSVQVKWDAEKVATERAAQEQAARNRDLQRAAEKKYVVQHDAQDHYFTVTTKEIIHDAAPLAACPVPDSVRLQLNALSACASGDSPAACGSDGEVPAP